MKLSDILTNAGIENKDDHERIVNAFTVRFGYNTLLSAEMNPDGSLQEPKPNPQTQEEFTATKIAAWIVAEVYEHELQTARSAINVPFISIKSDS